jgi:hypothetical protein
MDLVNGHQIKTLWLICVGDKELISSTYGTFESSISVLGCTPQEAPYLYPFL